MKIRQQGMLLFLASVCKWGVFMKPKEMACCKGASPIFAVIVFLIALLWLLNDLNLLAISVPWVPLIVLVVAFGWVMKHYAKN